MSIEQQIGEARTALMSEWGDSHKRCDFGDPVRGQGMRDGYYDGIEAGYRAAMRSQWRKLTPEEALADGANSWNFWASINGKLEYGMIWVNGRGGKPAFDIFVDGTQEGKRKDVPLSKCEFLLVRRDPKDLPDPHESFGYGVEA